MQSKWKIGERQSLLILDLISWLVKGEWIAEIWRNVGFAHSSVHTIRDELKNYRQC